MIFFRGLSVRLLRRVRLRLYRSLSRLLTRYSVQLDLFKFTQKQYIRENLLADQTSLDALDPKDIRGVENRFSLARLASSSHW